MTSVFSQIIAGQLPGHFVWRDDTVVALLTIAPLRPGHTLVVPREPVDDWTGVSAELWAHCTTVAQTIGSAAKRAFDAPRAGLIVAGFEVAHLHLHVFPSYGIDDFDFARAKPADPAALAAAAQKLRAALPGGLS